MKTPHEVKGSERALLVGVGWKRRPRFPGMPAGEPERESLAELVELARSAGAEIAGTVFQLREAADPATLVGRGKLDEIRAEAASRQAPLIIFDSNLSPMQQRNIEGVTECRVIDRTQLILDIFARQARSREGQLQVELAQLSYMLPRLSIEEIRKQRARRREARQAVPLGTIAIVGYTNAGKSTLFNALSRAEVLVSSRMFATLDPTIRAIRLPSGRRVLVSDTVGFIRDLPKGLLTAFRATLEEVQEAALIVHVSDAANPHHAELDAEVDKILHELGVGDRPRLRVLNKIDLLAPEHTASLMHPCARGAASDGGPVLVSAKTEEGLDELLRRLDGALPAEPFILLSLRLPLAEGRTLALIHALGRVLHSTVEDSHMNLQAEVPASVARRLRLSSYLVPGTFGAFPA